MDPHLWWDFSIWYGLDGRHTPPDPVGFLIPGLLFGIPSAPARSSEAKTSHLRRRDVQGVVVYAGIAGVTRQV